MLTGWAHLIDTVELICSGKGRFEVTLDGDLIFSKAALHRHAEEGEVAKIVRDRLGPEAAR